jgi:NitT/TauT family transport system permease protein
VNAATAGEVRVARAERPAVVRALADAAPPLIALAIALVVWEGVVAVVKLPVYLLPPRARSSGRCGVCLQTGFVPPQHLGAPAEGILYHAYITFVEAGFGLFIGSLVGLALAVIMVHSRFAEETLYPIIVTIRSTPMVAIAPIFIIWFGFTIMPKAIVAALATFYPMLVNCITGMRSIEPTTLEFFQSVHASGARSSGSCACRTRCPTFFAALRLDVSLCLIGAIVGELVGAPRGPRQMMTAAAVTLRTTEVFSGVIVLTMIGLVLSRICVVHRLARPLLARDRAQFEQARSRGCRRSPLDPARHPERRKRTPPRPDVPHPLPRDGRRPTPGVTGYGEISDGWGCEYARVADSIVTEAIARFVVGRDPRQPDSILKVAWAWLRRRQGTTWLVAQAMSGVEIALWDARESSPTVRRTSSSAATDRPVPVYASGNFLSQGDAQVHHAHIKDLLARGVRGAKVRLGASWSKEIDTLKELAEGGRPDIALFIDGNEAFTPKTATRISERLAKRASEFFEEPCPRDDVAGLARWWRTSPSPSRTASMSSASPASSRCTTTASPTSGSPTPLSAAAWRSCGASPRSPRRAGSACAPTPPARRSRSRRTCHA